MEQCDNTDHKGSTKDVQPVEMSEEFEGGTFNWCGRCRERDADMIAEGTRNCYLCDSILINKYCENTSCAEYARDEKPTGSRPNLVKILESRVKELTKQALVECLRANKDALAEDNIKTLGQLKKMMSVGVSTRDDWDDIMWHNGYIAGLAEALTVINGGQTRF